MKTLVALIVACGAVAVAHARPVVIEESARFATPDPTRPEVSNVAIDGDDALVTVRLYTPPDEDGYDQAEDLSTWLFRRVAGTWTPVREVTRVHHGDYENWGAGLAMQNGVAAITSPFTILERRNGDWVAAPLGQLGSSGPGNSIEIDSGRVIFGGSDGTYQGTVIERGTDGVWRGTATLLGDYRAGDVDLSGGEVDLSGPKAIVVSRSADEPDVRIPAVAIYDYVAQSGWQARYVIRDNPDLYPLFQLNTEALVRGEEILITGPTTTGTHVFSTPGYPSAFDYWPNDHLQSLDGFMGGGRSWNLEKNDLFVLQGSASWDRKAGVIQVFAKNTAGKYDNVATLAASRGDGIGQFAISGRRVLTTCGNEFCVFELPASFAQPAPVQDTFALATPAGWTLSAGSQFTVAQSGASRVLRQSETASTATHTALLDASANWRNEAIEADVRPTAYNGNDRWFGLTTRWRDSANYYYVTLRASGSVSLRKLVNGVYTSVASAPLAVTLGRTYRLRLESIGTRHRVYVDGVPLLDADDATFASGRAGVLMYRTAAEFDNVIVSPTPLVTDFADAPTPYWVDGGWNISGGLWTHVYRGTNVVYEQSSVAGDARVSIGVPTDAQTVEARVRPTTFAGTGGGERWFGLFARYQDTNNYYYVTLRSSNSISLRKRVDGQITVLGTAALPVALGTTYALRIEAVGSQVRAYVDGTLLLEASDGSLTSGVGGMVTYRTAADYDGFRFVQP